MNVDSGQDEFASFICVSRLAAVVKKEEPIERILKVVRKNENGINHERLVMILNNLGYREKVLQQLNYLGLIVEGNDDRGSFYHITEKGCEVLEACKG